MRPRQLKLLFDDTLPEATIHLGGSGIPFSQAANLLGREFDSIYFDAKDVFNLEALAIAAGSIKAGGILYLRLNAWDNLDTWKDNDSLRWSGQTQAIATPAFMAHLKKTLADFDFSAERKSSDGLAHSSDINPQATLAQKKLLEQILKQQADIYLLTAKRGRGKSALAGFLAKQLNKPIYLTAPNKNAAQTLQDFAQSELCFLAPDALSFTLENNPSAFNNAWLLVDEAAMIPLPQLLKWSQHFKHILFITTVQGYEGTGRGFPLKLQQFLQNQGKRVIALTLEEPLRWAKNDPLEKFIEELLLLNAEEHLLQMPFDPQAPVQIQEVSQIELSTAPQYFYGLLTAAHYRTSPIDLRRLLDAPKQRFFSLTTQENLLGALWTIEEGGEVDETLLAQIAQGTRRPKGNLVPQALSLQYAKPDIGKMQSLRISRIALLPQWQQHSLGSRLLEFLKANYEGDFLSVSFGYTEELAHFWQKNGFTLVHLGHHQEASSGAFSAIAICGLSPEGKALEEHLKASFARYLPLSFHPLRAILPATEDWHLQEEDWRYLQHFAFHQYPLAAAVPSLRRLLKQKGQGHFPHTAQYLTTKTLPPPFKNALKSLRLEIAQYLEE